MGRDLTRRGLVLNRLRRLLALPVRRQLLLLEGAWALLMAAWQVRRWPFARLASRLGTLAAPDAPRPRPDVDNTAAACARDVGWALAAWARTWPRTPTCLMLAAAAHRMLAARGLPCEVFFGVRGGQAGSGRPLDRIDAHAWLCCGGLTVTGSAEAETYQAIVVYRSAGAGAAAAPP